MNMEEARKLAENMTYSDAVYNALRGKSVPYKKATKIKLNELLQIAKQIDLKNAESGGAARNEGKGFDSGFDKPGQLG